jgi:hypothetical protein
MDDFTRNFFENSLTKITKLNSELNHFFEEEVASSDSEYATVDMLVRYKSVHTSVIERLESELKQISAIEAMGLGENDLVETEEEKHLYLRLIQGLEVLRMKIEFILHFFIDNLGMDVVREVLDGE